MKLLILSSIENYAVIINLDDFTFNKRIIDPSKKPAGFSCAVKYKDKVIVGSQKSSYFYISDNKFQDDIERVFIGTSVKEIKIYNDNALLLCNDINALLVYDLLKKRFMFEIPAGNYPFDFDVDSENNMIYICSFLEQKIIALEGKNYEKKYEINSLENPAHVLKIRDKIYILESSMSNYLNGNLDIVDVSDKNKNIKKIKMGKSPIYMDLAGDKIYILDIEEGNIRTVHINSESLIDKTYKNVGIMPTKMVIYNNNIYVSDYYLGNIIKIDLKSGKKINIAKVKEPSAMIIL